MIDVATLRRAEVDSPRQIAPCPRCSMALSFDTERLTGRAIEECTTCGYRTFVAPHHSIKPIKSKPLFTKYQRLAGNVGGRSGLRAALLEKMGDSPASAVSVAQLKAKLPKHSLSGIHQVLTSLVLSGEADRKKGPKTTARPGLGWEYAYWRTA